MSLFRLSHSKKLCGMLEYRSGWFDAFSTPSILYETTRTLSAREGMVQNSKYEVSTGEAQDGCAVFWKDKL